MAMQPDTDQLISEVQRRPVIWNNNHEDYHNNVLRLKAWTEIAENMYDDWHEITAKYRKIQDLQKKWKGLRDYFTKTRHRPRRDSDSGEGVKKPRHSHVLGRLQFMNVNPVPPHNDKANPATQIQERYVRTPKMEVEWEDESDEPSIQFSQASSPAVFQEAVIQAHSEAPVDASGDPDMHFVMTLLPYMKSMTPRENFDFRFGVMKLVKSIKYNDDDE